MDKKYRPSKEDLKRQKQIERRVKAESVQLDHPQGKERFARIVKRISNSK